MKKLSRIQTHFWSRFKVGLGCALSPETTLCLETWWKTPSCVCSIKIPNSRKKNKFCLLDSSNIHFNRHIKDKLLVACNNEIRHYTCIWSTISTPGSYRHDWWHLTRQGCKTVTWSPKHGRAYFSTWNRQKIQTGSAYSNGSESTICIQRWFQKPEPSGEVHQTNSMWRWLEWVMAP